MKKKNKFLIFFLMITCFVVLGTTTVSARNLPTVQPRAIRYDFNTGNMPALIGNYREVQYPYSDDGTIFTKFKYIRVRIESGSYGSFTVTAIGSSAGEVTTISPEVNVNTNSYIIDFKAKNAPTREDADTTVICSQPAAYPGGLVSDDYCIANPSATYGINIHNYSFGASQAVGAFSFEN